MAVLRGNVENNDANLKRIEEELQGALDRSGGLESQITQAQARIAQIEKDLGDVAGAVQASVRRSSAR